MEPYVSIDASSMRCSLFDWLCERVDNAELWDVAHADYRHDVEENYNALLALTSARVVPFALRWIPDEVTCISSYISENHSYDRAELICAAWCAVIQLLSTTDWNGEIDEWHDFPGNYFAKLLWCLWGEPDAMEHIECLADWFVDRPVKSAVDDDEVVFDAFILLTKLIVGCREKRAADLEMLVTSIRECEARSYPIMRADEPWTHRPVLGLTNYNSAHWAWERSCERGLRALERRGLGGGGAAIFLREVCGL